MKTKQKFCGECGSPMGRHLVDSFSEKTGKQYTNWHCTNVKCKEGCEHVGHQWGFFGFGDKCKRCGYKPYYM